MRQESANGGGDDAVQVFREGAQLGDVKCMVNFASLQMRRASHTSAKVFSAGASRVKAKKSVVEHRNVSEALEWLQTAAEKGCGAALLNIGLWHLGLNKVATYLDYLQRAARAGDVVALMRLGKEYASGARLVRDETEATLYVYIYLHIDVYIYL